METINKVASSAATTASNVAVEASNLAVEASNLAAQASKAAVDAVYGTGQSHEEPISGKTGDVSKGEPYDAGNMEPSQSTGVAVGEKMVPDRTVAQDAAGPVKKDGTEPKPANLVKVPEAEKDHSPPTVNSRIDNHYNIPEHSTVNPKTNAFQGPDSITPKIDSHYNVAAPKTTAVKPLDSNTSFPTTTTHTADAPEPLNDTFSSHRNIPAEQSTTFQDQSSSKHDVPKVNPAATQDSSLHPGDSTQAQNDIRSPNDPSTHPTHVNARENVDDRDGGLDADENPNKGLGSGPKSLGEVAQQHGGVAGKVEDGGVKDPQNGPPKEEQAKPESHPIHHATGFQADGGDFDAAAPGAGVDADRILESKGIHRDDANGSLVGNTEALEHDQHGHKDKTSLKQKIKDKLHKH
ncbi:uncharacterized protein B0T23DRAFT_376677 [Neurospora hispaniola]|uniref:Uncharacterized protein n=1 Tax=Neurospora hispaniola TaxID=588809 RepID=A0AAJ0I9K9_9PEZI|nr:hypothetical protein B0T23DRAFT_376677 [Neurospora hispaniola]